MSEENDDTIHTNPSHNNSHNNPQNSVHHSNHSHRSHDGSYHSHHSHHSNHHNSGGGGGGNTNKNTHNKVKMMDATIENINTLQKQYYNPSKNEKKSVFETSFDRIYKKPMQNNNNNNILNHKKYVHKTKTQQTQQTQAQTQEMYDITNDDMPPPIFAQNRKTSSYHNNNSNTHLNVNTAVLGGGGGNSSLSSVSSLLEMIPFDANIYIGYYSLLPLLQYMVEELLKLMPENIYCLNNNCENASVYSHNTHHTHRSNVLLKGIYFTKCDLLKRMSDYLKEIIVNNPIFGVRKIGIETNIDFDKCNLQMWQVLESKDTFKPV